MLLIDEDNEITHLTDRVSDFSGSDVSIQAVKTHCFCFKRSKKVSWDEPEPQGK